ncbi:MAG: hypothetical protein OSJ83_06900 [Clostridia bacterium]|nr:hypothetical protein [Clostridia bacterium]
MKNKLRSVSSIVAAECILIAMSCVLLMDAYSPESGENIGGIILLLFFALAANTACIFIDYFKAFSIVSFILSVVSFCVILGGRISYLAFFFSGDVMGTGLSLFLILALLFVLGAVAGSVLAVCGKNDSSPFRAKEVQNEEE